MQPQLSQAAIAVIHRTTVLDECGRPKEIHVPGEQPLTLYVDRREIVTLMTLGLAPELLILGYLRNQNLMTELATIATVQVDWETQSAAVMTRTQNTDDWTHKLARRTVTTGCGQGTVFGDLTADLAQLRFNPPIFKQSELMKLSERLRQRDSLYKTTGSIHGCALCRGTDVLFFIEDVGRHNAVDAISGWMWLNEVTGNDLIFYTTGRLTSEMVIKTAKMGIPILISRSGTTQMGLELAQSLNLMLIGRLRGRHFVVYHGGEQMVFEAESSSQQTTGGPPQQI